MQSDVLFYIDSGVLVNTSESALQYNSWAVQAADRATRTATHDMFKGFIALFGVGGSHKQEQQLVIVVLYKQILKPVWTYGIQVWGCTKPSNIDIIQRFQSKVLRDLVHLGTSGALTTVRTSKWKWLR